MEITRLLTDDAILTELGERISRLRLDLSLTQAELAAQAGVSKRTVERIEAGGSAQLASLIRVMRVLQLLPNLDAAIPAVAPRPMDLLKRKGKARQRASKPDKTDQSGTAEENKPWSWADDT